MAETLPLLAALQCEPMADQLVPLAQLVAPAFLDQAVGPRPLELSEVRSETTLPFPALLLPLLPKTDAFPCTSAAVAAKD